MPLSAARALAAASASIVTDHDVTGTLSQMLHGSLTALKADVSGLLTADNSGTLEVLAASSHRAHHLSLLDVQTRGGPCVDAWASNSHATAAGLVHVAGRWPGTVDAMRDAGCEALVVVPLRWDEEALGAMVVFRRGADVFTDEEMAIAQVFADLAMLVIVHSDRATIRTAAHRVDEALECRIVVEQAKGALAYQRGVPMAEAYDVLQGMATSGGTSLTDTARVVLEQAADGRGSEVV